MITHSVIQKSQLEGASRLDAEYYKPEYLLYSEQLHKLKIKPLTSLTSKIDVGFVSSMKNHFQDKGIPLLRTQNVDQFTINLEKDLVYIDNNFHKKLKKSQVFPGYVLLARSGSIGNAAVIPEGFSIANSADIILMKTKDVLPEYLAAFFNSKYGKFQIKRAVSGGLQGHINLYSLEKILIPLLPKRLQNQIKHIVIDGFELLKKSHELYSQAENLLLEELGLKDFETPDDLSYVVDFSEVENLKRIDADYFQPKYRKIISKIKIKNAKLLPEVIERVPARFIPKTEPDKTFHYVELANIDSSIGIIDGFSIVSGKEAPSRAKRLLKIGDVIVSSVKGSLGKVALVDKIHKESLASTGFFQFRSEKILPEVLLVLAKSLVLQMQLEKHTAGTILSAVPKDSLNKILIPVLTKKTQQKIANLVRKSHKARKKSKELLEKAKKKVEEMIVAKARN